MSVAKSELTRSVILHVPFHAWGQLQTLAIHILLRRLSACHLYFASRCDVCIILLYTPTSNQCNGDGVTRRLCVLTIISALLRTCVFLRHPYISAAQLLEWSMRKRVTYRAVTKANTKSKTSRQIQRRRLERFLPICRSGRELALDPAVCKRRRCNWQDQSFVLPVSCR